MIRSFFIILCICCIQNVEGQSLEGAIDLKQEFLKAASTNNYSPEYSLNEIQHRGDLLEIDSRQSYGIFIDNALVWTGKGSLMLKIDSLVSQYPDREKIRIFHPYDFSLISIRLRNHSNVQKGGLDTWGPRTENYFKDFSILTVVLLLIAFIMLFRTNTKLTLDYLNFARLFSLREREESLVTTRVTSSVNFIFYLFFSFLSAFILLIVFNYAGSYFHVAALFAHHNLLELLSRWIILGSVIFLILMVKLIILFTLAALFNLSEILPLQFFNFIRLNFLIFILLAFGCVILFLKDSPSEGTYVQLLFILPVFWFLWSLLIFLKLMAHKSFRLFHLFSYLCGSEIIPIVILFKILY